MTQIVIKIGITTIGRENRKETKNLKGFFFL